MSSTRSFTQKIPTLPSYLWLLKCPYYGYESSYFGFGSPQQQVDMHARSKKHFHCLKICIYFFLFCSRLPNGSFNDSFFQTPPLRDANLRWLVWWPSLLAHSSVINTQTAMVYALAQCRNALIKHCSLYTNVLLYSLSELQIITTTNIHYSSTHF